MIIDKSKSKKKSAPFKTQQPTLRNLFIDFYQEITKFVQEQTKLNKELTQFVQEQRSFNNNLLNRLDNIEQDIKLLKNTPTMKKELH